MPIEVSIPVLFLLDNRGYRRNTTFKKCTISDELLQAFIQTPTATMLGNLIRQMITDVHTFAVEAARSGNGITDYKVHEPAIAQQVIQALVKKSFKKTEEQQDNILTIIKALTSETDSDLLLCENFSKLSACVTLLKSLNAKGYEKEKQLFLQKLTIDYLISISEAAKNTDIIDLLQALPAAQQQQYLEKLDDERLRVVLNDGFTLHGALDSLAESKSKRALIDRLGIEHVRNTILSQPETGTNNEDNQPGLPAFDSPHHMYQQTIQKLQEQKQILRKLEQRLPELKQRLPELKQRLPELQERLPELQERLPELKQRLQKQEQRLQELKKTLRKLERKLEQRLQEEIITLQEEIPALKQRISKLVKEIPALQEEIPALKQIISKLVKEIPALQEEIPALQKEIPALQEEIPALQKEIPALKKEIRKLREEIQAPILELAALLRSFKTDDDNNTILKQLGTEFLLTILSNTENLSYFFQQINTDKQRLVINMLGTDNLKKLLTPSHTESPEECYKPEVAFDNAQGISRNLTNLLRDLHPTNYTVVLNLLGQDWFRENKLSGPLTDEIAHFDYEKISALLPFLVTPENIQKLVSFAFSYDLERIDLISDQPLVENAGTTGIQAYNTSGELPLVYLLWQSLTSDESKKWIKANHALLNKFLATSLKKWQAETKITTYTNKWQTETDGSNKTFNQKYYLSALAHDGILAACVTNGSEFTNIIKQLHQDAQITFLKTLGSEHLKALISNWAMLGRGALAHLNPEAQNCLLELLEGKHLSTLLANKTERAQVTSYLHLNNQRRLTSMLRRQQLWQYTKIAGAALAITAGVGAFAYMVIPGAASVITAWATSILVAVQSLANAVVIIAYSWQPAQYAINLCIEELPIFIVLMLINKLAAYVWRLEVEVLRTCIVAMLLGKLTDYLRRQEVLLPFIVGMLIGKLADYLWRNKNPKPAVAAKKSRVGQASFKEHIIVDEAKKEPRSVYPITARYGGINREQAFAEQYNGAVLVRKDTKVNPKFVEAAKASLKKRRAEEQTESEARTALSLAGHHPSAAGQDAHPPLTRARELHHQPYVMPDHDAPLAAGAGSSSYSGDATSSYPAALGDQPHGALSMRPRHDGGRSEGVVDEDRSRSRTRASGRTSGQ